MGGKTSAIVILAVLAVFAYYFIYTVPAADAGIGIGPLTGEISLAAAPEETNECDTIASCLAGVDALFMEGAYGVESAQAPADKEFATEEPPADESAADESAEQEPETEEPETESNSGGSGDKSLTSQPDEQPPQEPEPQPESAPEEPEAPKQKLPQPAGPFVFPAVDEAKLRAVVESTSYSAASMATANKIRARARAKGVPETLALVIAMLESRMNPKSRDGQAGEVGMMQVIPREKPCDDAGLRSSLERNIDCGLDVMLGKKRSVDSWGGSCNGSKSSIVKNACNKCIDTETIPYSQYTDWVAAVRGYNGWGCNGGTNNYVPKFKRTVSEIS